MNATLIEKKVFEDGSAAHVMHKISDTIIVSTYVAGQIDTHVVQNKQRTKKLTAVAKKYSEEKLQKLLDMQSSEWHYMHNEMYSIN